MISIIIPTYNRVDLLPKAMKSVQVQTIADWEMIVVDDASTDGTNQMVQSWQLNDPRIKYHKMAHNSGSPVVPRNYGVSQAKGDFVAFLDSDDWWTDRKLETQLWYMKYHGSSFTYHNMFLWDGKDTGMKWNRLAGCHSDYVFEVLLKKNFIPTSSVMLKKGLYEGFGGMDVGLKVSHDWDLWLKIARKVKIHYVNEPLGYLNFHEDSVITSVHRRRKESRAVVRKWMNEMEGDYYRRIMAYYYLMELFDVLPKGVRNQIRQWWYKQRRFKK